MASPSPVPRSGARWVRLVKALEDANEVVAGNADSGVAHPAFDKWTLAPRTKLNTPAGWRELYGVRQQIAKHLPNLTRIRVHHHF